MSGEEPSVVQRIVNAWDCCGTCAGGVLAAHDAATAERVRRETAEGVADALAAHADQPAQTVYHSEYLAGVAHAARIAREQAR